MDSMKFKRDSKRVFAKPHPSAISSNSTEEESTKDSHRISAQARKQRRYRQRLKNNPDIYRLHRAAEAERSRAYRQQLSEDKKAAQREQSRLRAQKRRQKRNLQGKVHLVKKKPESRAAVESRGESVESRRERETDCASKNTELVLVLKNVL